MAAFLKCMGSVCVRSERQLTALLLDVVDGPQRAFAKSAIAAVQFPETGHSLRLRNQGKSLIKPFGRSGLSLRVMPESW